MLDANGFVKTAPIARRLVRNRGVSNLRRSEDLPADRWISRKPCELEACENIRLRIDREHCPWIQTVGDDERAGANGHERPNESEHDNDGDDSGDHSTLPHACKRNMRQSELFPSPLPDGFTYREEFLSRDEERELISMLQTLPLEHAQYKQFTALRRTLSYGSTYDFSANKSLPAPALPAFLYDLRRRIAGWSGLSPESFVHALVAEYRPGTSLGWHRDVPEFEVIAGISLLSACRLRLRPYPWIPARRKEIAAVTLAPRSAYLLRGDARWKWQHSVPPVKELRYSITLRTKRAGTPERGRRSVM